MRKRHGSGRIGVGRLFTLHYDGVRNLVRDAPQCGLHAVGYARRKHIGPLVDGLVGDADGVRCGGDGAAEKFDGFGLEHATLNHSSERCATIVHAELIAIPGWAVTLQATMVATGESTYTERLVKAMKLAGVDVAVVASALGITYTAMKKAVDGKTHALSAENNSKAAKFLKVDSDWLATGEGSANFGKTKTPVLDTLPFSDLKPFEVQAITFFRQLPLEMQQQVLTDMSNMARKVGSAQSIANAFRRYAPDYADLASSNPKVTGD